ncbi:hypothetical protein P389DRAFT_209117 [Cystobasidium minutum MCA 4210]|uniref:uncharacterized protein n=1 Tax=Cystobasidium minutum MCA 4210 TaxID=1397322 RepID=UPI0034CE3BB2|eukprot:jgi/Rhomi1/209117/estExt_Genemark1.C_2_t20422
MDSSIRVSNHEIQCPIPGLPPCLLQLVLLQSQTFIWMGQYGGPARVGVDWSAAMPGLPTNPSSAMSTTLSRGTNSDISLAMSKRLSRRFKQPIFLSLDLPSLHSEATGISEEMSGRWSVMLEKLIVDKMEQELASKVSAAQSLSAMPATQLAVEPVGR